jgi:hypothetical protein
MSIYSFRESSIIASMAPIITSRSAIRCSNDLLDFRGTRIANPGRAQFIQIYPFAGNLAAGPLTLKDIL